MSGPRQTPPGPGAPAAERALEWVLFSSRWLLAPLYAGLILALLIIVAKFAQEAYEMLLHAFSSSGDETIIGILALIDLSLMANLVLMVMFAGYENFISKFDLDSHRDKPDWMGHVDFGDLKLKLMASIVAISGIKLLESFMNIARVPDREMAWTVGVHLTFVVTGLLLGLMDRITGKSS